MICRDGFHIDPFDRFAFEISPAWLRAGSTSPAAAILRIKREINVPAQVRFQWLAPAIPNSNEAS